MFTKLLSQVLQQIKMCPYFCINIMHHFTISTLSIPESHTNFSFQKGQPVPKVARRILYEPTRIHYTRANVRKKMEGLE